MTAITAAAEIMLDALLAAQELDDLVQQYNERTRALGPHVQDVGLDAAIGIAAIKARELRRVALARVAAGAQPLPPLAAKKCETCRHFDKFTDVRDRGLSRRFPPHSSMDADECVTSVWVETLCTDECGEYVERCAP